MNRYAPPVPVKQAALCARRIAPQGAAIPQRGFTLIELLVTVSIVGILLTVAVPSFSNFIIGQRVKTAASDIGYSLTLARSEAIKRRANVAFSPATGGWQNGWTVSANATTISSHEAFQNVAIAGPSAGVTFNNDGRAITASTAFNISSAATSTVAARCVTINLNGMANSRTGAC